MESHFLAGICVMLPILKMPWLIVFAALSSCLLSTKLSGARFVLSLRLLLIAPHIPPVVPVRMYFCVILVG
jgi:hypothetical protein